MYCGRSSLPAMNRQDHYFEAVVNRNLVRPSVRAIVLVDDRVLVQQPADDPTACYAFIGGRFTPGGPGGPGRPRSLRMHRAGTGNRRGTQLLVS